VYLGDIKSGSSRRDTSYFEQIRADFDRFQDPLVYTPGDNEWTDCHRANNGAYTPTERLDTLRQVFFDRPAWSLGRHPRRLDAQHPPYVENVAWSQRAVRFATLHVGVVLSIQADMWDPHHRQRQHDALPRVAEAVDRPT
jgi:hypothetical protein